MVTGILSAIWLGILTSISPCPLATNITAISYLGRDASSTRTVLFSGLFYIAGRTTSYLLLSALIVASFLSVPDVSHFLQKYMNKILGPVLILTGMFLLELLHLNIGISTEGEKLKRFTRRNRYTGSLILGIVFALSFCPVSAALFFGGLLPLSIKFNSIFLLPALFGIGTALPVIAFALLIAVGTRHLSKIFDRITQFDFWMRKITGIIFIIIGIYLSLTHIFGIQLI